MIVISAAEKSCGWLVMAGIAHVMSCHHHHVVVVAPMQCNECHAAEKSFIHFAHFASCQQKKSHVAQNESDVAQHVIHCSFFNYYYCHVVVVAPMSLSMSWWLLPRKSGG